MSIDPDNFFDNPPQNEMSSSISQNKDPVNLPSKKSETSDSVTKRVTLCCRKISTNTTLDNIPKARIAIHHKFEGNKFIVSPLAGKSAKELKQIEEEGSFGVMIYGENDEIKIQTPSGTNIPGTKPVVIHNPDGTTTTHTSVKFETLSDKELAAVRAQIKARIVYLKLSDPDNKDKRERELKYLETLLKFVESEEALRNKKPDDFKRLNGKQINTISKMEAKWSALRAMQNTNQQIREERAEEKQETVRVIVKQKVIKEEIIKEGVLFARTLGKTVLEAEEAKEKINGDVKENGSKVKTVDYVSISPTINKNPRRVFVNMGSLLIRYRSV